MVTTNLNLSMNNPEVVQIHAKQGDSGRLYKVNLKDATEENGTLRILRPDGVEVTADALKSADIEPTEPTDLVTFTALEEVPLTKLEVTLESSQDLHGQSSPYPAGGKGNLLPNNATDGTTTLNGITLKQENGVYSLSGTASDTTTFTISLATSVNLSPSTNKICFLNSGAYAQITVGFTRSGTRIHYWSISPTNRVVNGWTDSGNESIDGIHIQINSGVAISETLTISPMLVKLTDPDPTSYAPYSNICPIVPSNGKNLWRLDNAYSADASGSFIPVDASRQFPLAKGTYTWSFDALTTIHAIQLNFRTAEDVSKQVTFYPSAGTGKKSYTFTLDEDVTVLRNAYCDGAFSLKNMQIEKGSTATPYVPYQGINVYQSGRNLFDANLLGTSNEYIDGATGNVVPASTTPQYRASGYVECSEWQGKTLTLNHGARGTNPGIAFYDANGTFISGIINASQTAGTSRTFTVPSNAIYLRFTTLVDYVGEVQLEEGEEATPYEPYNGTTHSISLGRSVYGGYVDLVSGKLTVEWGMNVIDGTQTLTENGTLPYGGVQIKYVPSPTKKNGATKQDGLLSDKFYAGESGILVGEVVGRTTSGNVFFNMPQDITTVAQAITWFTNNPTQLLYKLATPTVIDLTPQQISTLLGTNNIFGQTIREVAFEYDGLLAELPQQATAVVGRCLGDVLFTNVSTMPFTLNVIPNNQEETP